MSKLHLALRFLDRLNGGRIDEAIECLSSDFRFVGPDGGAMDRTELASFFKGMSAVFAGPYEQHITGTTSEGDRVALEATGRADLANGRTYANRYHLLFEFRADEIVAFREYADTRAIDAAFGP